MARRVRPAGGGAETLVSARPEWAGAARRWVKLPESPRGHPRQEGAMQRALGEIDGFPGAIAGEELDGTLGEEAPHFAAAAFFARDREVIVAGRLVAQPSDGGGGGPGLEGNALSAGHRAAADGRGVFRDELSERGRRGLLGRVKIQILMHRLLEILRVVFLDGFAPLSARLKFF